MIKNLVIAALFSIVKSDQPVHCLRENVYGTWDFFISQDT